MRGRDFPFGLLLAWVAAMGWLLTRPLIAHGAPTAPFRVVCPMLLPADMVPMRSTADGWTATSGVWPVDDSGMLHGAPNEGAYLLPDWKKTQKNSGHTIDNRRWSLYVPHGHEKWIYCGYGPVQLARRVPVDATECTVTVDFKGKQRGPTVFVCK